MGERGRERRARGDDPGAKRDVVAGEAVGGDGFLAAFAAGMAVTVFNQTLCDCFLEFGQVIAEMTMLLAFVLFGALLSTLVGQVPLLATLALAGCSGA